MVQVGDRVLAVLPSGRTVSAVVITRHADGSVTIQTDRQGQYRAEAVVAFKVKEDGF